MNYEKQRQEEMAFQKITWEAEQKMRLLEIKRNCLDFARSFDPEDVDKLVKDSKKIYDFIKE